MKLRCSPWKFENHKYPSWHLYSGDWLMGIIIKVAGDSGPWAWIERNIFRNPTHIFTIAIFKKNQRIADFVHGSARSFEEAESEVLRRLNAKIIDERLQNLL